MNGDDVTSECRITFDPDVSELTANTTTKKLLYTAPPSAVAGTRIETIATATYDGETATARINVNIISYENAALNNGGSVGEQAEQGGQFNP